MTHEVPHDIDAEQSVLGAVLMDNYMFAHAQDVIGSEHFYRKAHAVIYDAMRALAESQTVLDYVTVCGYLERRGELEAVGGPAYVASLTDGVPHAVNIEHYARIVREKAIRRDVIRAASKLIESARASESVSDAIDGGLQSLMALSGQSSPGSLALGPQLAREAEAWLDEMSRRRADRRVTGVSSGLPGLDALTDGFQPGELVIVGARPSQGKSALALQFALAAEGVCAFFSLEMGRGQLAARALATLGRIDGWAMRRGLLTRDENLRLCDAMAALKTSGLQIDDSPQLSVAQLRAKARRVQVTTGALTLVICDYLQLMSPPQSGRREGSREQDVAALTRGLKAASKELGVPVIALAQLNRATEQTRDKEPTLANLRESGAVEQDADLVLFIHRADGQSVAHEGDVRLVLAKNRTGPTGVVDLRWHPSQTRFASQVPA